MNFSNEIIKWYNHNKRDLPWRRTKDPYKIWIAEIILQQTRVDQGMPYYIRFLKKFPSIESLAKAKEKDVLNIWQGLGYYSRARNLHFTARHIVNYYDSIFPSKYSDIRNLKGIGDYTAAAIASFCYNLPYAVIDGNVSRLLSRFFAVDKAIDSYEGKKCLKKISQKLLNIKRPSLHNQAIMEFGALQCTPRSPNCNICPLKKECRSFDTELINILPIKIKSTKIKERYFNYLIIKVNHSTFIHKRSKGIWKSLYQFPLIEGRFDLDLLQKSVEWSRIFINKDNLVIDKVSRIIKHQLSHQTIFTKFIHVSTDEINYDGFLKVKLDQLDDYPIPILIDKYLSL